MSQSEETDFSQGKKLATFYYHYIENRPGEVWKLVEKKTNTVI